MISTNSGGTAESHLRHMTDKNFVLSVAFLSCVCSVLAVYSSNFQPYDSLVNDLFNNHTNFLDRLDEILEMIKSEDFGNCFYMKTFISAQSQLEKGEFKGVPTIGRNTLWHHYKSLVLENIFTKFNAYVEGLKAGFLRRMSTTTDNSTLKSYAGFLHLLLASVIPHGFYTAFDPDHLAKIMDISARNVENGVSKLCGFLTSVVKKSRISLDFNAALRVILTDPVMYNNLPPNVLDGLIFIITIPCSETIAETQGSSIDALHLRYKHTDPDDRS